MRFGSAAPVFILSCALTLPAWLAVSAQEEPIAQDAIAAGQEESSAPQDNVLEPTTEAEVPTTEPRDDISIWLEALDAEELGAQVRSSAILLGPDGMLHCSLFRLDHETRQEIAVKQMKVTLIQNGNEIEVAEPDPESGKFQFGPLKQGIYSIVGYGADGFSAFSFVVEQDPEDAKQEAADARQDAAADTVVPPGDEAGQLSNETENSQEVAAQPVSLIHSSALDPQDVPMALELIRAFVHAGDVAATDEAEGDLEMSLEEAARAKDDSIPFRKLLHDPNVARSTSLEWHTVRLRADGVLVGRILVLVEMNEAGEVKAVPPQDMQVFVVKDGRVVSRAPCSSKGGFAIPDLTPEIYSFVGVGSDGFVALTVDVLPTEDQEKEDADGSVKSASFRRVAQVETKNNTLNIFTNIVPPAAVQFLEVPQQQQQIAQNTELPMTNLTTPATSGGNQSGIAGGAGPIAGVGNPSANPGGFGGSPGGGTGGGGGTDAGIPEIDPASSGVGLSVLIGLLFLLIDLYRPR